ncbi:hypothetical protein ACJBUB_11085 [Streptococcus suis]
MDETDSFAKKIAELVNAKELGTEQFFMYIFLYKRSKAIKILNMVCYYFEKSDEKFLFLD